MQQSSDRIMQLTTSAMYFKRKELGILKTEIIYTHPNYVEIIYNKKYCASSTIQYKLIL